MLWRDVSSAAERQETRRVNNRNMSVTTPLRWSSGLGLPLRSYRKLITATVIVQLLKIEKLVGLWYCDRPMSQRCCNRGIIELQEARVPACLNCDSYIWTTRSGATLVH